MTERKPKSAAGCRFDVATLQSMAGGKVFERGKGYHANGQVELLSVEPRRILAEVAGSEIYRTVLSGHGKKIGGQCSCPAHADWGFCKHMVAVALAVNQQPDNVVSDKGASPSGTVARIRKHLKAKGTDALVDMIVDIAERDTSLFRKLDLAATIPAFDGGPDLEARLRRAIDRATRIGRGIDDGGVSDWATGVENVLEAISGFAAGEHAAAAMRLAEHAIDRIEQALDGIDDSDGHCGALLEQAGGLHHSASRAARPDPKELARDLFKRQIGDEYGVFDGAVVVYSDILGKPGLEEYRRLARAAWDAPPSHAGESDTRHAALLEILDFFAEREGDVDGRIALRAKHLSSQWAYLQLAEFCLEQGRSDEALKHAQDGLWMFEDDRQDERLAIFAGALLMKRRRKDDAAKCLWRAFERAPSLRLYGELRRLGAILRARAIDFLRSALDSPLKDGAGRSPDLLLSILIREKQFDSAWSALEKHGGAAHLRMALAEACEKSHPEMALSVFSAQVESFVGYGRYEEAVQLARRMAAMLGDARQAAYIGELGQRHGRKRNFIKLLQGSR